MYAIISELDTKSTESVKVLWLKLKDVCNLKGIYDQPTPHLSWFVAEDLDIKSSVTAVNQLTGNNCGFTTQGFGIGFFTGVRPVLYLPLVKTQEMIDIHNQVWDQIPGFSKQPNPYYDPSNWMPHVTLAVNDLSIENLACALGSLVFDHIELSISIDNMIIVAYGADPNNEPLHRFRFCG